MHSLWDYVQRMIQHLNWRHRGEVKQRKRGGISDVSTPAVYTFETDSINICREIYVAYICICKIYGKICHITSYMCTHMSGYVAYICICKMYCKICHITFYMCTYISQYVAHERPHICGYVTCIAKHRGSRHIWQNLAYLCWRHILGFLIRVRSCVREILSHAMDIFGHLTHRSFKMNDLLVKSDRLPFIIVFVK